jgi:hypothetical protein
MDEPLLWGTTPTQENNLGDDEDDLKENSKDGEVKSLDSPNSPSFMKILKKDHSPSPPLIRGRKSNRDRIVLEAKNNIRTVFRQPMNLCRNNYSLFMYFSL